MLPSQWRAKYVPNSITIFKEICLFSLEICRLSLYCLLYVDAACFTDIGFCVVSQSFMVMTFRFRWDNYLRERTTMLIGTSPELEFALYTLCFKARPGENCPVSLGGRDFTINTKTSPGGYLRSAYFIKPRGI